MLSSTTYKTLIQRVVIISSSYDQAFAVGNARVRTQHQVPYRNPSTFFAVSFREQQARRGLLRWHQPPVAACISCLHQLPASAACISCLHQLPASAATCRLPASAACINQPAAEHARRRRLRGPTVGTRNLYPSPKSPSVSCPVAIGCGGRSVKRFLGSRHQRCTLSHALYCVFREWR